MAEIVAPNGSPVAAVLIGVESLERSLAFYRDRIGMTVVSEDSIVDAAFNSHWHIPETTCVSYAALQGGRDPVGQIVLARFETPNRSRIRNADAARGIGLFNLNFYTDDIEEAARLFKKDGYEFWSDPVQHQFGPDVGSPIEVVFEGPDGVPINLVELATTDPATRIGQMRAFVDAYGRTAQGYTPVVTTSHGVHDRGAAQTFYESVLQMAPLIDETLGSPDANRFLRLAPDARTHVTFMQGNHMFGKVVLAEPLNYECVSLTELAVAPNVGYIAQTFEVTDLDATAWRCAEVGAEVYSPVARVLVPGRGERSSIIVRNPGSGALQQIIGASPK